MLFTAEGAAQNYANVFPLFRKHDILSVVHVHLEERRAALPLHIRGIRAVA